MNELDTVLLGSLLADDKAIAVGVMYPGEDTPSGIPLIRVADIIDGRISSVVGYRISEEVNYQYRRTQLSGDEVLMTLVGRPGIAVKVPQEKRGWNAARALAVLKLADPSERDFFVYSVASPQVQHTIRNWCNTTVQATLNLKEVKALPLPWPDHSTRQAIASVLGALDDKIELNRRLDETLEAMARAIFKDWFVDFGPTRAKMEGREPYLAPDLWSLFPNRLDDVGKPEGWEIGRLGDTLIQRVERLEPSDWTTSNPYVPIDCISPRNLALAESRPGKEAQSSLIRFYPGDLLFGAMRPYFHKVCIAPFHGTTRTTVIVLMPKTECDFSFSCLLLHEPTTIEYATNHSTGTTIPYATWKGSLEEMPIIMPPRRVRQAFQRIVHPLLMKLPTTYFENQALAATRNLLLPKLMSGEIRINVAEKIAGDTT